MKIEDAYIHFLDLVEKNATNNNLNVDKPRFVEWFNYSQTTFQDYAQKRKNDEDIRVIQAFLVDKKLIRDKKGEVYDHYGLPQDYFDFSNLSIKASKGKCIASDFLLNEVKKENVNIKLSSVNEKPSFKARETFYHLMDEGLVVYHNKDFNILGVNMSYYRKIKDVDIEGYIRMDGSPSVSIDPEIDDKTVVKVLNMMQRHFLISQNSTSK